MRSTDNDNNLPMIRNNCFIKQSNYYKQFDQISQIQISSFDYVLLTKVAYQLTIKLVHERNLRIDYLAC